MSGRARNEHPVRASASSIMRKLSVASIASNFTKRSGSVASLQRALDDVSMEDPEIARPIPEKSGVTNKTINSHVTLANEVIGVSLEAVRRFATLTAKTSCAHDGERTILPPLRTSNTTGIAQNKIAPCSIVEGSVMEEKDDTSIFPQITPIRSDSRVQKHNMWRVNSKRGIRNLFR